MNNKGQALVEFVLILPVFILLIFSFIDVGKIILCKNELESAMNEVSLLVRNDTRNDDINLYLNNNYNRDISFKIVDGEFKKIILSTKVKLTIPGLNRIFNENIKVERSIINE